jgi:hypothetical protein
MRDENIQNLLEKRDIARVKEELEKKFFPKSHEKKIREKVMKDPKLFEEYLKEKLRKCVTKK